MNEGLYFRIKMSSWLKKTFDAIPLITSRKAESESVATAQEFKTLIRDLKKNKNLDACVCFFMEKYAGKTTEKIKTIKIEKEISLLVKEYVKFATDLLLNENKVDEHISFCNEALTYIQLDTKSSEEFFKLLISFFDSNNEENLKQISSLAWKLLERKNFVNYAFDSEHISIIFEKVFIKHKKTKEIFGLLIMKTLETVEIKSIQHVEKLLSVARDLLNDKKIAKEDFADAFSFILQTIKEIDSENFMTSIYGSIIELSPSLSSLSFFETIILLRKSEEEEAWKAMGKIMEKEISPELTKSLLIAIYKSNVTPPDSFSFSPFIKIINNSSEIQEILFKTVKRASIDSQTQFLCSIMPIDETKVKMQDIAQMIHEEENWGENIEKITSYLLLDIEQEKCLYYLDNDHWFYATAKDLLERVDRTSDVGASLFGRIMSYLFEGNDFIMPLIVILAKRLHPSKYMESLIGFMKSSIQSKIYLSFSEVAQESYEWCDCFFKAGGAKAFPQLVQTTDGLTLMSAIASDGPYEEIDSFVNENFELFKKYDDKTLSKLMIGSLSEESSCKGFIRIPSLVPHVKDALEYSTPYDKFIIANEASKYMKMEKKHVVHVVEQWVNAEEYENILSDTELLLKATNTSAHHSSLYQFHPSARKPKATVKLPQSFAFWFYIDEQFHKTTICSLGSNETSIYAEDGKINILGNYLPIENKTWCMISIVTAGIGSKTTFFLDNYKQGYSVQKTFDSLTFGGDKCGAIWFISTSFPNSSDSWSLDDINEAYSRGYAAPSPYTVAINFGVRFVPYHGILKFFAADEGIERVFLKLMSAEESTFKEYLECLFNILELKKKLEMSYVNEEDFFNALRYVFLQRKEMFNDEICCFLFEKMKGNWKQINLMFSDFYLINSPVFLSHFSKIETYTKEALPLFKYILDSFVFCDLEASEVLRQIIEKYTASFPELFTKIALVIAGLSHCESDTIVLAEDKERIEKQKFLFDILIEKTENVFKNIPTQLAFTLVTILPDELAIRFLAFIADICRENESYFDFKDFKLAKNILRRLSHNEKVVNSLLSFITNKKEEKLEDYCNHGIERPQLFVYLFNVLCYNMAIDIVDTKLNVTSDSLSYRLFDIIVAFVNKSGDPLSKYTAQIRRLCAFGFDEREPSLLKYSLDTEVLAPVKAKRRSSLVSLRKTLSNDTKVPLVGASLAKFLGDDLFDKANAFIRLGDSEKEFEELKIEIKELPENFEEFMSTKFCNKVIDLAVKLLLEVSDDTATFKKTLASLTTGGFDVLPTVIENVHRKIILVLFDQLTKLSREAVNALIEYLTPRISEGWWNDYLILLLDPISNLEIEGIKLKTKCYLVFACFIAAKTKSTLLSLAKTFIRSQLFMEIVSEPTLFNTFLHFIINEDFVPKEEREKISKEEAKEEIDEYRIEELWSLIQEKLPESELVKAIKEHELIPFMEQQQKSDTIKIITDNAKSSSTTLHNMRSSISRNESKEKNMLSTKLSLNQQLAIRRFMRYEFFYRVNLSSCFVNKQMNKLFQTYSKLKCSKEGKTRTMLSTSSHPMSVPQKLIPCTYEYEVKCEKEAKYNCGNALMPLTEHDFNLVSEENKTKELKEKRSLPLCYKDWCIPAFVDCDIQAVASSFFDTNEKPINCKILNTPEQIECVGIPKDDLLIVILYASIPIQKSEKLPIPISQNEQKIELIEDKYILCHYGITENILKGFGGKSTLFFNHPALIIKYSDISLVVPRQCEYRDTAVDIFTCEGLSYTIVMQENIRKNFLSKYKANKAKVSPNMQKLGPYFTSNTLFFTSLENVEKMWLKGELSTMDYLLYLNAKSGRSFTDFSQYPVFPWIVADYRDKEFPKAIRDLSKPMGMLSESRAEMFKEMYKETDPHYNYGTHYSSPALVMHFLMRIEPFTLYNVMLHSGWDHKDRLFFDIGETWRSSSESSQADVKELTPEFYSFPYMLINPNNLPIKQRTDGTEVKCVALPPWSSNAFDFIWKMRKCLESDVTKERINDWIDLIFGYKQRGQAAIDASNVFSPLSYGLVQNPPTVSDIDAINNFGQCPRQLFQATPHEKYEKIETNDQETFEDVRFCKLQTLSFVPERVLIKDRELFAFQEFHHNAQGLDFTVHYGLLRVAGEHKQFVNKVFDISCSAVSPDETFLSIGTNSGYIFNYRITQASNSKNGHFVESTTCCALTYKFTRVAVSTHMSIVCATTDANKLVVFDLSTGLLINETVVDGCSGLVLDDTYQRIILSDTKSVRIFTQNLDEIVNHSTEYEISSLCTGDSIIWEPHPMHVTGHKDGSVSIWSYSDIHNEEFASVKAEETEEKEEEKNVYKNNAVNGINVNIKESFSIRLSNSPIVVVQMFSQNKALFVCDSEGKTFVLMFRKNGVFLKEKYFDLTTCSICKQSADNISICSSCGMPACKQCRNGKLCSLCNESTSEPSSPEKQ